MRIRIALDTRSFVEEQKRESTPGLYFGLFIMVVGLFITVLTLLSGGSVVIVTTGAFMVAVPMVVRGLWWLFR